VAPIRVQYLKDHPTRYKMLQLKDIGRSMQSRATAADPSQWIEMFPIHDSVSVIEACSNQ